MISVCIITKNEKDKLEKCLKALSEYRLKWLSLIPVLMMEQ